MCGSYGDDGKGYVLGGTALIAARLETRVNYCVLDSPTYRIRNTTAILGELGLQLGPCGHRYSDRAGRFLAVLLPYAGLALYAFASKRNPLAKLSPSGRFIAAGGRVDRNLHRHGAGRAKLLSVPTDRA